MSRKFDVSLLVTSKSLSLAELTGLLERPPQSGSHDKGSPRPGGKTWSVTIWRENARDPSAPFEVQCAQLLTDLPSKCSELIATKAGDIAVLLDVAAYFQTAYLSLMIPPVLIRELSAQGIGLEITTYPTAEPTGEP